MDDLEKKALEMRERFGSDATKEAFDRNYQARACGDGERALFWGAVGATIAMQLDKEREERDIGRYIYPQTRDEGRGW